MLTELTAAALVAAAGAGAVFILGRWGVAILAAIALIAILAGPGGHDG